MKAQDGESSGELSRSLSAALFVKLLDGHDADEDKGIDKPPGYQPRRPGFASNQLRVVVGDKRRIKQQWFWHAALSRQIRGRLIPAHVFQ